MVRVFLKTIFILIEISIYMAIIYVYTYLFLTYICLKNKVLLNIYLLKYGLPREIRSDLMSIYDKRIIEVIDSLNPNQFLKTLRLIRF